LRWQQLFFIKALILPSIDAALVGPTRGVYRFGLAVRLGAAFCLAAFCLVVLRLVVLRLDASRLVCKDVSRSK
jgi:hypothetical protein